LLEASVVICTHNPRADYFARVLDALRHQTIPSDRWELLVIDNASDVQVAHGCPASWHPRVRHLVENELGVATARRRGMREAVAELIVFVDDDNVLDRAYLAEAIRIGDEWPLLGAWGSGCIRGEYEIEPQKYLEPYLRGLAIREATRPSWSNVVAIDETIPWGAGLCLRREVARAYCRFCEQSPIPITGRLGDRLLSGEDKEIAHVCCAGGLGTGIFPQLKITHLIPRHRVDEDYLVRLTEGTAITDLLIDYKWKSEAGRFPGPLERLARFLLTIALYRGIERRIRLAKMRAIGKGRRYIRRALARDNRRFSEPKVSGLI
jgi:glycosyltransferase involved in cell wall biosynthesis